MPDDVRTPMNDNSLPQSGPQGSPQGSPTAGASSAQMMTPREIVQELDRHIVGQSKAKRAVAIALRNRWRRAQIDGAMRGEIHPKNILMIGPTGVGKTEIARRLAKLANAPFVKVEATKFTEVGYVGKDVDTIVRDLVDVAVKMTREQAMKKMRDRAESASSICCCRRPRISASPARSAAARTAPRARCFASSCARASSTTRRSN